MAPLGSFWRPRILLFSSPIGPRPADSLPRRRERTVPSLQVIVISLETLPSAIPSEGVAKPPSEGCSGGLETGSRGPVCIRPEDGIRRTELSIACGSGSGQRAATPAVDLDVKELARFLAWLEGAARSGKAGEPMPDPPTFRDQTVMRWAQMIVGLAAGADQSEATLRADEAQIIRLRAAGLNLRV